MLLRIDLIMAEDANQYILNDQYSRFNICNKIFFGV